MLFPKRRLPCRCQRLCVVASLGLSLTASFASDQTTYLRCQLFANGTDHVLVFSPTSQPYTVKPVDLERFRFKAIVNHNVVQVDHIKITVSYRSGPQALVLQQATYFPPFTNHQSLTGRQQLYSPDLGRELSYDCSVVDTP